MMKGLKDLNIENRVKALKEKLLFITQEGRDNQSQIIRCNGYLREIVTDYDRTKFRFAPGEVLIDRYGKLAICVGVAKAPDSFHGEVMWFLSENENEIHYLTEDVPFNMSRNYVALAS